MMKKYVQPQIEVIEIEIEDAVLGLSDVTNALEEATPGNTWLL